MPHISCHIAVPLHAYLCHDTILVNGKILLFVLSLWSDVIYCKLSSSQFEKVRNGKFSHVCAVLAVFWFFFTF